MTIFTVRIPHRLAPTCWTATDEQDFIALVAQDDRSGGLPVDADFGKAVEVEGSDMSRLCLYKTTDEAVAALNGGGIAGHQGEEATKVLAREVERYADEITIPALCCQCGVPITFDRGEEAWMDDRGDDVGFDCMDPKAVVNGYASHRIA